MPHSTLVDSTLCTWQGIMGLHTSCHEIVPCHPTKEQSCISMLLLENIWTHNLSIHGPRTYHQPRFSKWKNSYILLYLTYWNWSNVQTIQPNYASATQDATLTTHKVHMGIFNVLLCTCQCWLVMWKSSVMSMHTNKIHMKSCSKVVWFLIYVSTHSWWRGIEWICIFVFVLVRFEQSW